MADVCVGRKQNMVEKTALSPVYSQPHHMCDLEEATRCTAELLLLNIAEERLLNI